MNARHNSARKLGTLIAYAWLIGGMAYYLVHFSRSFFIENEVQIRRAAESVFGG